jgi:glyoxylase-like metal-dependent hydrolase (beta-lactamase superfamily II)
MLIGFVLLILALPVTAQDFDAVEIKASQVSGHVWMLEGAGGTLGVSVGEDGIFLIDDQYAPLSPKILAAIAKIQKGSVTFVLNTHWHGDHVGGNENMGKTGSLIVAHDNVRARMSTDQFMEFLQRDVPASPQGALPVVTFSETVTFHINGDTLRVVHVPHAHTDGDALVHFAKADVIHMGDLYFSGMYPFIDLGSGGSVGGLVAGIEKALAMSGAETRFIAGHGPGSGREGLEGYLKMIRAVRDRVAELKTSGKSLEEALAARPTADLDETWGQGWIKGDEFVEFVYRSL